MFGLSFAETAVILLVAVVAIGPKELPRVVRAVARTLGQIRQIGAEFRKQFDDLSQEAELAQLRDDLMTPMPTIIDLDGNEQPTFDISEELARDASRREAQNCTAGDIAAEDAPPVAAPQEEKP